MIGLYFAIIILVCYLIGNINFAKIIVRLFKKEDITQKGSGNPGTMNVMRNYGIPMGFLVLVLEAVKAGLPAIICATVMQTHFEGLYHIVFFAAGISVILGQIFPIINKFRGGKGIACTAGLFFFTPYWWVALIVFVVCAILLYLFDYAFLSSLIFVTIMIIVNLISVIITKVEYYWLIVILLSFIWLILMIKHKANFKRFFTNNENKTGFRHKILMAFSNKYREWIKQEEIKELQKKEAAKKFLEEQELVREQKKELKKEEKQIEKQEKKVKKANKKARKSAKKKQRKVKKTDKRVKKLKNGKRNPFRLHKKKKSQED